MYADGMSATQIINVCNERGYKTSRGNPFNKNSLRTMLKNDKYIGVYRFMDVVVEGGVPAIISKELFDKVQASYSTTIQLVRGTRQRKTTFSQQSCSCGHCGSPYGG